MAKRIFITAAEVSGDLHASHLAKSLLEMDPTLVLEGHGGPRMRAAGVEIHRETTANAAMGLGGVGRVAEMFRLLKWTRRHFKASPPDLQVCVDSPAMNFHFAKLAKAAGVPVLAYVAPQLWAWREGRMKKVRKRVDRLACILPFEEAYFRSHGIDARFVGHPLFDELKRNTSPKAAGGFGDAPVIGLLAGSRRGEAEGNFSRMLDVARRISARFPGARYLLPTTEATHPIVMRELGRLASSERYEVRQDAFDEMVPRCDLAITVSGTATLHVALHNTPMIVVYRSSPVVWNLLGRWVVRTRTYALVNLLAADPELASSGRVTPAMHVVPEFIPWYGSTGPVAERAIRMLSEVEELARQRASLGALAERLESPGASHNVAKMAMEMIGPKD
jgi:lipid-A-disaccharide synthase